MFNYEQFESKPREEATCHHPRHKKQLKYYIIITLQLVFVNYVAENETPMNSLYENYRKVCLTTKKNNNNNILIDIFLY